LCYQLKVDLYNNIESTITSTINTVNNVNNVYNKSSILYSNKVDKMMSYESNCLDNKENTEKGIFEVKDETNIIAPREKQNSEKFRTSTIVLKTSFYLETM